MNKMHKDSFQKVHSTVWHISSFLPKLNGRKQNNKVLLLPNAEYSIVLLSLPFNLQLLRGRFYRNTGHIHIACYSGVTLKKTNIAKQGLRDVNVMIDSSEVWKQYIRQFENRCDNPIVIVPVQHVSLSDNNPSTSALQNCTFKSQKHPLLRPYASVSNKRSLVCI